jgi:hypothetical protein
MKPAPLATLLAVVAAVVTLAESSSADAGLGDRLRAALHDRRAAAAAAQTAARGSDANRSAVIDKAHGRAGGDPASDWDTIYSAAAAPPAHAAAAASTSPLGTAPRAPSAHARGSRRRAR